MFGDVGTQRNPVSGQVKSRVQPRIGTTVKLQRPAIQPLAIIILASSPTVIPCTYGIGYWLTNEIQGRSTDGPSTRMPPSGFGRSSTTNSMLFSAAASMHFPIVLM